MQIIVTPEELRAHEKLLNDWHTRCSDAALAAGCEEAAGHGTPERNWKLAAGRAAMKFEAANPSPKLIPSV